MMLMMVVAMVMAMAKIFAFRFYISKLPINRLRGRYVTRGGGRGQGAGPTLNSRILTAPKFPNANASRTKIPERERK